ncbi:NAD(P)H-binding protein [Peribacillus asahii]|uniref:NADH-flavin reductase n=1 Tax=Peribacillus asahii TaxID=228899 RepID=A0A3Q9RL81_9BACI|nr:NAD(P)H-binding protein [Peribacillus asahii]AZV41808.1 NADH-flavin reductase [Peribacillus asahii]USK86184.1 NAD(P)H-binding protein [Peribacillus asahii]
MDNPYKIGIIGGTGKVGRHIATNAIQKGYKVRMLVRNPEKLLCKNDKIEIVEGQIQDIENIRELLKDCKIVINTFGQPTKEEPMYSKVTKNILEVMKDLNISRYIGVSGGSLTINDDKKSFLNRFGAKMFELSFPKMMVDKKLEWEILFNNKHIHWTLIRLPFVKDSLKSNYIKESLTDMPGTKITNQDIATFIIDHIDNPKYIHKAPFISH